MKLDQLRKIIREEVRSAVKEELQDILNEAVKHASTPNVQKTAEHRQVQATVPPPSSINPVAKKDSIEQMLEMTKNSMTNEEYKNVFTGTSDMVTGMPNMASTMMNQMNAGAGRQPGIDISNLDFVNKAKAVLDASNKKSAKQTV